MVTTCAGPASSAAPPAAHAGPERGAAQYNSVRMADDPGTGLPLPVPEACCAAFSGATVSPEALQATEHKKLLQVHIVVLLSDRALRAACTCLGVLCCCCRRSALSDPTARKQGTGVGAHAKIPNLEA